MRSIVGQMSSFRRTNSSERRSWATWNTRCSAASSTSLDEREHRSEEQPMALSIEHGVVEHFGGLQGRVLIEQHGAEDRLLRLVAPRSLTAGELGWTLSR